MGRDSRNKSRGKWYQRRVVFIGGSMDSKTLVVRTAQQQLMFNEPEDYAQGKPDDIYVREYLYGQVFYRYIFTPKHQVAELLINHYMQKENTHERVLETPTGSESDQGAAS